MSKKKLGKLETIEIELDMDTFTKLKKVGELARTDMNTVINVILASEVIKLKQGKKIDKEVKK
jgi:hypothetical protein